MGDVLQRSAECITQSATMAAAVVKLLHGITPAHP